MVSLDLQGDENTKHGWTHVQQTVCAKGEAHRAQAHIMLFSVMGLCVHVSMSYGGMVCLHFIQRPYLYMLLYLITIHINLIQTPTLGPRRKTKFTSKYLVVRSK